MIYLTFDTNIWIYSLDDSWKLDNQLDYIESWIENGKVKLLIPKIVLDEWKKHEKDESNHRKLKLNNFFSMAEEILPSAFFEDYKTPNAQDKIITDQIQRISNILSLAEIIPSGPEIEKKVIENGLLKKAPLHSKSSIADAIIIYSLFHFANQNKGDEYFFISDNKKDFYKEGKIHPDLKEDFDENNITAFRSLNLLIHHLINVHGLNDSFAVEQKRKERIKNKLKEYIYNPEYNKLVSDSKSSFIQNTNLIEYILRESKPTKEQVILVLSLIDSDEAYEKEFYKRLDNHIWYPILKKKGVFRPENNPRMIKSENGFRFPFWNPLSYINHISKKTDSIQEFNAAEEIIDFISRVSERAIDNYRTWIELIRIINNLPNDEIPIEIFDFIPIWLGGSFDNLSQSSELCKKTLPKFLNDSPTKEDVLKAELILKYLFGIKKSNNPEKELGIYEHTYYSKVYLHFLTDTLLEKRIINDAAKYCSLQPILLLADNINKIYFDFPIELSVKFAGKGEEHEVSLNINNETLNASIQVKNKSEKTLSISDFSNKEKAKGKITKYLQSLNFDALDSEENQNNISWIIARIFNGSYYVFSGSFISKMHDTYFRGDKLEDTLCYIFRDYLNELIKNNHPEGLDFLASLLSDSKFRLSFFKRVALYVISENWEKTNKIFWNSIQGSNDFFSNYQLKNDLYEMLNKNQNGINEENLNVLNSIISKGPFHINPYYKEDKKIWCLQWYSALKETKQFKPKYEELSKELKITNEYYEKTSEPRFMPTNISPINIGEILEKGNQEIVENILSFQPKDTWEEPSINGFANAIEKAVENNPDKFAEEIQLYSEVYYIYCYHLMNGFQNAWKNRKSFNWQKVIEFCDSYISSEKFALNKLGLKNDGWRANKGWVVGAIANLLSSGMRNDDLAFDLALLSDAKTVLIKLTNEIRPGQFNSENNLDYPTHFLNSVEGKVLGAFLDYSLRRARNILPEQVRWESDIKAVFDTAVNDKIIDVHIITGMFYPQFLYLDKKWLLNRIKENENLELDLWKGFLGGLESANPPNKEIYKLALPQYKKAIEENIDLKNGHHVKLIRHIVAFYFWGFESHDKDGLVNLLLTKSNNLQIQSFINEMVIQKEYKNFLTAEDKALFEDKIYSLWLYLVNQYSEASEKVDLQTLAHFADLIVFISELKDKYTDLIIKSTSLYEKYYHNTHYLLEKLLVFSKSSNTEETARGIAKILNSIPFEEYILGIDHASIKTLVIYLFENKQKDSSNEICNKITRHGDDFLREVYNRYNQ